MLFISSSKAQKKIAENVRERRLQMDLTQEGLAERSGVPLSTLRKFEQKGNISLESFLKSARPESGFRTDRSIPRNNLVNRQQKLD